jgi:hypothetical protein
VIHGITAAAANAEHLDDCIAAEVVSVIVCHLENTHYVTPAQE